MKSLLILGRQPAIGLAELVSLYGDSRVEAVGNQAAIVDIDPCNFQFDRLGGCLKFAKLLETLDTDSWIEVEKYLLEKSPAHSQNIPSGKMTLGLSLYGFSLDPRAIIKSGIKLKKAIQTTGRSVRLVPNKAAELNAAQIIHNKLTSTNSWELLLVRVNDKTYIAQTVKVQDIDAYAGRDQKRPFRDSRVGMLPPKLAQIIINLASRELTEAELDKVCEDKAQTTYPLNPELSNMTLLDPFCGSGVILQEAILIGYRAIGSDISERMVEYSSKNLEWLKSSYHVSSEAHINVLTANATKASWQNVDFVASETNLGKPLSVAPSQYELDKIISSCDDIIRQFLINIKPQLKSGTRFCLAIPAWQTSPNHFKLLPVIDAIEDLGYNFVDFKHISAEQLIYYRPDQIVGRQLLVITRK